ncbi:hypothetical protein Btru_004964 [Bulinus truncatus]|nr:hypothetical protein Btru_004964 [Bulinus truncatus]
MCSDDFMNYEKKFQSYQISIGVRVILVEPGIFKTHLLNIDSDSEVLERSYSRVSDEVKSVYGDVVGRSDTDNKLIKSHCRLVCKHGHEKCRKKTSPQTVLKADQRLSSSVSLSE